MEWIKPETNKITMEEEKNFSKMLDLSSWIISKQKQTKLLWMKRKFMLRCLIFLHGLDQNRNKQNYYG